MIPQCTVTGSPCTCGKGPCVHSLRYANSENLVMTFRKRLVRYLISLVPTAKPDEVMVHLLEEADMMARATGSPIRLSVLPANDNNRPQDKLPRTAPSFVGAREGVVRALEAHDVEDHRDED